MYKVRTIDVWDTLLRRDCHPECIKLLMAQHIWLGYRQVLRARFSDFWEIYSLRLKVEEELSQANKDLGNDDEYALTSVIFRWLEILGVGGDKNCLSILLADVELNFEIERSYPDPHIDRFLENYPAERSFFLSDFYMGAEKLSRLLVEKGLERIVRHGFSSCDVGFNKRSGRLFGYVHKRLGLSPDKHIHIGDNEWSDVESARLAGVYPVHYLPDDLHAKRLERNSLFPSRIALFDDVKLKLETAIRDRINGLTAEEKSAFILGVKLAPIFIGYVLWVAEEAVSHKLESIQLVSPEADAVIPLFDAIFPGEALFGHKLPPVKVEISSDAVTDSPQRRRFDSSNSIADSVKSNTTIGVVSIGEFSSPAECERKSTAGDESGPVVLGLYQFLVGLSDNHPPSEKSHNSEIIRKKRRVDIGFFCRILDDNFALNRTSDLIDDLDESDRRTTTLSKKMAVQFRRGLSSAGVEWGFAVNRYAVGSHELNVLVDDLISQVNRASDLFFSKSLSVDGRWIGDFLGHTERELFLKRVSFLSGLLQKEEKYGLALSRSSRMPSDFCFLSLKWFKGRLPNRLQRAFGRVVSKRHREGPPTEPSR